MAHTEPLSIRQLEVFVALVDQGSFTRAAKSLGLSQSTVSGHMADLERRLGLRLVTRERSGVEATSAGQIILPSAQRALRAERSVRMASAELTGLIRGRVVIGASTIPADYLMPAILARFREKHPGIAIEVRAGDSEEVVDLVVHGDAEAGFVGGLPKSSPLEATPVGDDRLVLIVPADHAFAGRAKVTLKDVVGEPLVGREEGSGTWRATLAALRKKKLADDLDVICRVGSTSGVKAAVRAGLGVAFVSHLSIEDEVAAGTLASVPVTGFDVKRQFHVVSRKPEELSPAGRVFVEVVREDE